MVWRSCEKPAAIDIKAHYRNGAGVADPGRHGSVRSEVDSRNQVRRVRGFPHYQEPLLFERWVSRRALPVVVRMKTETGGPEPSLIPFTLVADGAEVLVDTKNNQDEFRGNARKNDSDQHAGDR